jgi:hypothetical protein
MNSAHIDMETSEPKELPHCQYAVGSMASYVQCTALAKHIVTLKNDTKKTLCGLHMSIMSRDNLFKDVQKI